MRSRLCGSTPTVGSSSSTTRGRWRTPQAMFRRRFMPPENLLIGSSARSSSAVTASAHLTALGNVARRESLQAAERAQVLARGQGRIDRELLRHDAELGRRFRPGQRRAEQPDLPGIQLDAPRNRTNERGLAGAVRAEQRQQLSLAQRKRRAVERDDFAKLLARAAHRQDVWMSGHVVERIRNGRWRSRRLPANGGWRAVDGSTADRQTKDWPAASYDATACAPP